MKNKKKNKKKFDLLLFLKEKWVLILFLLILAISLILRLTAFNNYPFGWDQVDNAWATQKILVNGEVLLNGMVAKGNSGIFIGPLYYYFLVPFYFLTGLHPIASEYIALVTGVFSLVVIFYVTKKIFSPQVALIASFINSVSFFAFYFDVVQWPVQVIPGLSLLIFYFLYKVICGEIKYILGLAVLCSLAFHIHFTAIFYLIICFCCLPFFPWKKENIKYFLISIPLFLVWFIPSIVSQFVNSGQAANITKYISTYYHGIHLTRFLQLARDGIIQFDSYIYFQQIVPIKFLLIPLFTAVYLYKNVNRKRLLLIYVILLFFLVPWFVFSTYKGEISDYYFTANRFVALFIISYLLWKIALVKKMLTIPLVVVVLGIYAYFNITAILKFDDTGLSERFPPVEEKVERAERIEFHEGVPESYIYYYLMRQKGVEVY